MIAEFDCGHVAFIDGWPGEQIQCTEGPGRVGYSHGAKLTGVECREWKSDCAACRYARWHGQSQGDALLARTRHLLKCRGPVMTDYLVHPDTEKALRKLYGSKVKPRVSAALTGVHRTDLDTGFLEEPPDDDYDCPF